jgi:hypothetical protein
MSNPRALLQSLFVYLVCLPLAVYLGYLLANPNDQATFFTVATLLMVLSIPLLLRYHYPLLLLSWNMSAVLFFLPGQPQLWLAITALSFGISVAQRMMDKRTQFIHTPEIMWPLVILIVVILVTAKATGGIGLRSMGGDVYGGRRYVQLLCAIIGFFAISWHRIPPERAKLYVALFFLGGVTSFIGDLYMVAGPLLRPIFLLFPPTGAGFEGLSVERTRFIGLTGASGALFAFMLAKYGVRGLFASGRPLRAVCFLFFCAAGFLGGFRSLIISFILVFSLQFLLEGMHRTRLMPAFLVGALLLAVVIIPILPRMPATFQRALAFLPVPIDPTIRRDAQGSSEWRLRMWKVVLPQVPQYLLLGKGYAMSQDDFAIARQPQPGFEENWGATLAGDYHNGPLSVIIPFGIWGAAAFLWFLIAALRVLYRNYRYGNPQFKTLNTFLLATFVIRAFMFFVIVGGFYGDMMYFVGIVALNISINGGVARPVRQPLVEVQTVTPFPSVLARSPRFASTTRQ